MGFFVAKKTMARRILLSIFIATGVVYNLIGISEFLFGWQYGSAPVVLHNLLATTDWKTVTPVITYNDTGTYELTMLNKHKKRFYTHPMFEETNRGKFTEHVGYYFVVEFPEINRDSIYWHYFETCQIANKTQDKLVSGYVFDCRKGDRLLFMKK
jgi:hypothetical protein